MTVTATADTETVDNRDPEVRLRALFDAGTMRPLTGRDDSGVLAARGEIDGTPAVAFATDAMKMGGAMGTEGCRHVVDAIDAAVRERVPVIGLWHCGGARLAEGVVALDGVGQVFAAMVRASGRVPQISVVLGPAAGGAAYGPALTDIVIMSKAGRIFVTGPEVVRSVTGEQVDMERLGGPEPHGRRSGVVHVTTKDDASAMSTARELASLLGRQGRVSPADVVESADLGRLLPEQANRAYDVKPLVNALLDAPGVELHAKWAPNVVTALGRFAGRTIGVIANNPLRLGGCLDTASAEKAARFVRSCDAQGVRRRVHRDDLALARCDRRVRLARRRGGGDGRQRRGEHPAPQEAGRGTSRGAGGAARQAGRGAAEGGRRGEPSPGDRRGRRRGGAVRNPQAHRRSPGRRASRPRRPRQHPVVTDRAPAGGVWTEEPLGLRPVATREDVA